MYVYFYGAADPQYGFLSNWYMRDFIGFGKRSLDDETKYSCVEQYMMASKAILFGDEESYHLIMTATHPREMKKLGRKVKNFDQAKWDYHAQMYVYTGCYYKFSQNADLLEKFLATHPDRLVEASPYDLVWGCGFSAGNIKLNNIQEKDWPGTDLLGRILTTLRQDFINQKYGKLYTAYITAGA